MYKGTHIDIVELVKLSNQQTVNVIEKERTQYFDPKADAKTYHEGYPNIGEIR